MEEEIWKDIPGYEGLYQASNLGNIRALTFRNNIVVKKKIRLLKQQIDKYGRKRIMLTNNKKYKLFQVHTLVALTFLDKKDFKSYLDEDRDKVKLNELEINHKDENPLNNNVSNLEWCTRAYNTHYGTGIERMGRNHRKKIIQKTIDNKEIKKWNSIKEASDSLNINNVAIFYCCKGKSKTSGGYRWEYANE